MSNRKIFTRLFISHTVIGMLAIVILSSVLYVLVRDILIQRTLDQLSSVNILKKKLIENYFLRSEQDIRELQLENKFVHLYHELKPGNVDEKQKALDLVEIDSITKLYGFKNLYVFDIDHRPLFGTTNQSLIPSIQHHFDSLSGTLLQLVDATAFSERHETLLFYYVQIRENDQLIGYALVQENMEKIQQILVETTGMGSTGESYIVGADHKLRTLSRFFPDSIPATIHASTVAVNNVFNGSDGTGIIDDYRNIRVMSAYRMIGYPELQWAVISEMDTEEAMLPVIQLRNYLLAITLFIVLFTLAITYFLSNAIAQPILQLRSIILSLSRGVIPVQQPLITSTDEIGQMAQAIQQLTEGMERTTLFANEIGAGNFGTSFSTLSHEDALGIALIRMRDELKQFNDKTIRLARERTAALLEGQENERRRIIKELHDGVGQLLTAIRISVDNLEYEHELKGDIKARINETIDEVKRISYNVMPQAIVDYGLEAALKGLCDTVKKYSRLNIDFRYVLEHDHKLNFETSIAVFRIAQEALNNIVKHAEASDVNVHILDKEDEVYFVIEDNGKGFSTEDVQYGLGIRNIKERAQLLNGSAEIHTTPGDGTVVEVHIPHTLTP